ncbi:MAG TPA: hypothetical protein VLW54_12050 [Candidatus Acidoferrales bacterium]|nr:hypothetical protein [Candidatus Acidoferrales bacterium]
MSKRIIVLGKTETETEMTISVIFWFPITSFPAPQTGGSAWVPVAGVSSGASTAENQAIQAGTVKEEGGSFTFPVGTPVANLEAVLLQAWSNRNAQLNGVGSYQYYGAYNDSSAGWAQT